MSWAGLINIEGVSYNDLQDAINNGLFTPTATALPAGYNIILKSQLSTYLTNYNTSNTYLSPKPSNQTIEKQDLTSTISAGNTADIKCSYIDGYKQGWSSSANACASGAGSPYYQKVYYSGTFGNGTVLYSTSTGGSFLPYGDYFYTDSTYKWYYNGNTGYSFYLTNSDGGSTDGGGNGTYIVQGYTQCVVGYNFQYIFSNAYSGQYTMTVYHNGSIVITSSASFGSNISVNSGDTIRVVGAPTGSHGHSTNIAFTGNIAYSNYGTDLSYDTGTVTVTQNNNAEIDYGQDY